MSPGQHSTSYCGDQSASDDDDDEICVDDDRDDVMMSAETESQEQERFSPAPTRLRENTSTTQPPTPSTSTPHNNTCKTNAADVRDATTTSSSRARDYFSHLHKDGMKAPNVTVLQPATRHPLFAGRPQFGAHLPPTFAMPSSLRAQQEELLRHQQAALLGSQLLGKGVHESPAASAHFPLPPLDSAQHHLSHLHQMYLHNYYATLQHHLQRSSATSDAGQPLHASHSSHRYAPYFLPNSSANPHYANRIGSPKHRTNSPHASRHEPITPPPLSVASSSTSSSPAASPGMQHTNPEKPEVTSSPPAPVTSQKQVEASSRANKFSIASLTAKD